jgi:hypothetical protein
MPYQPTQNNEKDNMLHEKWMEYVSQANPNVRIKDMLIPATHDVGTYGISKKDFFYFSAQTQRLSIYDQLRVGSRNMDLRYGGSGPNDSDVNIFHGPYKGPTMEDAFQQIVNFVSQNNKEFVMVTLQKERAISNGQKAFLMGLIQKYLTPLAITSQDESWFSPDTVTLGQVTSSNKRLFVLGDNALLLLSGDHNTPDTTDYGSMGLFLSKIYYHSDWANVNKTEKLLAFDTRHLLKNSKLGSTFLGTQMIMTFQTADKDIVDYVFGEESLRIDHFTKQLQAKKVMAYYLLKNLELPFNYVELDYIDYNPCLVKFLIGLNFPQRLTIIKASADQLDVTSTVKGLVSRDRVLYMPDIQVSLGLPTKPKNFSIEFIYEGDSLSVKKSFETREIKDEFVLTYIDISTPRKY